MKRILIPLFSALLAHSSAEVFIGPTTPSNRLVVEKDQAILISFIGANAERFDGTPAVVSIAGTEIAVTFSDEVAGELVPHALGGPAELIFTNTALVSFKRIQTPVIHTLALTDGSKSSIEVPANRTVKLFTTPLFFQRILLEITMDARRVNVEAPLFGASGLELSGPLSIRPFVQTFDQKPGGSAYISYYFLEDSMILPELGVIQGSSGQFEIIVEKSSNLGDWQPVVAHISSSDQHAFYRLRISR